MNQKYIPEREDIIWLDFQPTKGKEIGKYRPAITEVSLTNLDKPSVVASSLVQTLSWKDRNFGDRPQQCLGLSPSVRSRI